MRDKIDDSFVTLIIIEKKRIEKYCKHMVGYLRVWALSNNN